MDLVHPIGALAIGVVAGLIFVYGYSFVQERLRIDDVLGVWPLHGVTGTWGGIACGVFGTEILGGQLCPAPGIKGVISHAGTC